ncbi:hypothetical protein B0T26DRAFT_642153 [Lasiosphaeria miniovina]|uniref:Conidiation-specific protein 10 n=1 Tax=Lasiosphaeria miniovina TaxID=1954250 RepID=A0AA40AV96_9PEZI|nr:uncharacterized protein B0T26DRAFT_642153 [Lasiosphaeria miniovina]KAK0722637.1 hypothetical protein B0T26DRAFT_642153 [Lasiosphaeria miniovina]
MADHGNNNPGNFANHPTEEVREIAAKGGRASHKNDNNAASDEAGTGGGQGLNSVSDNPGNFANRPKEEVRAVASKGGQASSGSFEAGSERAREAGRKGGLALGGSGGDDE